MHSYSCIGPEKCVKKYPPENYSMFVLGVMSSDRSTLPQGKKKGVKLFFKGEEGIQHGFFASLNF